ncbi:sensor histidine kinase [Amycolatopsis sp. cg5]|uniref:sensor histidine kinase n=1 Tax=Amycolatopsis sp. cg5 TaxID=3238802 RepID=UPI00352374C0
MALRARELLDRSRVLLDRSRVAAATFLTAPPKHGPEAPPRAIEAAPPVKQQESDGVLAGICSSVALRDLNLVDALLAQLEQMEAGEQNQDRLSELYKLDHLATRLRRNAENLRVLAGRDAGEPAPAPTSLVDVMRAAMSSIDHYSRVTIGRVVQLGVVGFASEDLSRVLAELFDNAANQSAPNTAVSVSAHLTEQGSVLLRIEDEGIGLPDERIDDLNARLNGAPVLDDESVRHMGIAVVGRLAGRHGMKVRLDRRTPNGTVATVMLPAGLMAELPESVWSGSQTVVFAQARRAEPMPRRTPVATAPPKAPKPKPTPHPRPASPSEGGITASGLPRRVSRSIRTLPDEPAPAAQGVNGHDQLLADLGAFSEGEQAARTEIDGEGNTR